MYRVVPSSDPNAMHSRWAGQIVAHPYDLENIKNKINNYLTDIDDTFVSEIGKSSYLRSRLWNNVNDRSEVLAIIAAEMDAIRGCIDALDGCGEAKIGTIIELDIAGNIKNRSRNSSGRLIVLPEKSKRSSPAQFREIYELAKLDDSFRAAVVGLDAFAGWHSLYISIEACLNVWGGLQRYKTSSPINGGIIDRAKTTANWHRHASVTYPYPKRPTSLDEAFSAVKLMIAETADHLKQKNSTSLAGQVSNLAIPRDEFSDRNSELPRLMYGGRRAYDVTVVGEDFSSTPEEIFDD